MKLIISDRKDRWSCGKKNAENKNNWKQERG